MKLTEGDLIIIKWRDAISYAGWVDTKDRVPTTFCFSVGWVMGLPSKEKRDYYMVSDVNDNENSGRTITIPEDWVMEIEVIKSKEGENVKKKKAPCKDKKPIKKAAKTPKKK
jgi:hypothetical protein